MRNALAADPAAILKNLFKSGPPKQDANYVQQVIKDESQYVLQVRSTAALTRHILP